MYLSLLPREPRQAHVAAMLLTSGIGVASFLYVALSRNCSGTNLSKRLRLSVCTRIASRHVLILGIRSLRCGWLLRRGLFEGALTWCGSFAEDRRMRSMCNRCLRRA